MAERPITIKPFSRRAAGSLARRVLYGSLALLALPLLIHTFFLYWRDYRENYDDAFFTLQILGESRVLYLEQMIQSQHNLLDALSENLPAAPAERAQALKTAAREYQVNEILYIAFDTRGTPSCSEPICTDSSFLPFWQEALQSGSFAFVNPSSKEDLYVGQILNGSRAALVIATPTKTLLSKLAELIEDEAYPLRVSLIDESGTIFTSTEPELVGKKFAESSDAVHWISEPRFPNAWLLKTEGETLLAFKLPVQGTHFTLLVDLPESTIKALGIQAYVLRITSFVILICLLGGGLLFWFTRRISKPLRALVQTMRRVEEGGVHCRYSPDRMGFEINVLGQQFNQMLDALLLHQQEAERERLARERLAQELKIGHDIQASMLPASLPNYPGLDIAPAYIPAREVSGDFYDFFVLKDGRLLIAVADAAGKGISACLYSLGFRSILRAAAETRSDLASIVEMANSIFLHDSLASSFFITAWIGLFDPSSKELAYCCLGHPPALLRHQNGEIAELKTDAMAFGIEEFKHPPVSRVALAKGDLLLLYTDGVIEAHDPDEKLFGKQRLAEFVRRNKQRSARGVTDELLEEIRLFCRDATQADDVTVVALFADH